MSEDETWPEGASLDERLAAQTRSDVDSLTQEDRDRGERILVKVPQEIALRHAAEAAGVTVLGKERLMRLRRANQRKWAAATDRRTD